MKKFIAITLVFVITLAFPACTPTDDGYTIHTQSSSLSDQETIEISFEDEISETTTETSFEDEYTGEETTQYITEETIDSVPYPPSKWTGKNVLVFGDSISTDLYANYTKWATVLANNIDCQLYNYSVHGYGFVCGQTSATQGPYNMINQIENARQDFSQLETQPDLIILFMGTNDFGTQVPIGNPGDGMHITTYDIETYLTPCNEDSSTISTFYGGVEHCMARIKQLWPTASVCVLTPLQRHRQYSTAEGMALKDYRNIIIEISQLFSYPVKDLYTEANFAPVNRYDRETKTYQFPEGSPWAGQFDGVHPNEAYCRDVLAVLIQNFIQTV